MIRLRSLVWIAFLGLAGCFCYLIRHEVDSERARLRRLNAEILSTQDSIRVLKAEWSHLSRPERIADLADRHTRLVDLTPAAFTTLEQLPLKPEPAADPTATTLAVAP